MASLKVNKTPYDFASLEFALTANGEPLGLIIGFDEINYSDNVEREYVRGASRVPLDATEGEYEAEGNVTFHRNTYNAIVAYAKALGIGLYDLEFTITVSYRHKLEPIVTDTITEVRLASRENSHSQGPEKLVVPCDLFIKGLIYNDGLGPFGETL